MNKLKSISEYFFSFFKIFWFKLIITYFKSNFYNKRISINLPTKFFYIPSLHIINSLTSFNKKKIKIENFSLNSIWQVNSKNSLEFKNLHSFLWLVSLDLKTTKSHTQVIIENWIDNNFNFNEQTWKLDILSTRLISWVSNSNLILDDSNSKFKEKFILSITKQANHLYKNINNMEDDEEKLICCSSLILIGLVFKNFNKHLELGLYILQKVNKNYIDDLGFPKSRSPEALMLCLKYLIIIKEWIKESQKSIPEHLEETIFNCGKSYNFLSKNLDSLPLFNGTSEIKIEDFEKYLKYLSYHFDDKSKEKYGFVLFKEKKIVFIMDVGKVPNFKYSKKYQSGCLSFEITSNHKKLISNLGFDSNKNNKIKLISKSTAAHSTLYMNDQSSCTFKKHNYQLREGLKILNKKIISEKNFESIIASHNGYQKRYGYVHERSIKFVKNDRIFIGIDNLIKIKKAKNVPYNIRFHVDPAVKMVKTKNSHSVLLSLINGEGWKFNCMDMELLIEKGIYLGNKSKVVENENICISGMTLGENQTINWSIERIS